MIYYLINLANKVYNMLNRIAISGGSYDSWMVNQLDEGVNFFNYRGYYGVSGFNSGNINSLSNGFKLPIATVITCGTGSFSSGTAISEAFVRAGTPAQPKGAVASVGTATIGTHTMFNNAVNMGFYYGVFVDKIETVGAALVRGKLNLLLNYPDNPNNWVDIFTHWNNLIGDPALQMWTDVQMCRCADDDRCPDVQMSRCADV